MSEISPSKNDFALLLEALYAEADRLSEADWKTKHLQDFHVLCKPEARQSSEWEAQLDRITSRVKHWWERYRSLQVTEIECTAETLAGHRLLVEGLAGWLEAVELCRQGEFDSAKEAGIEANRLLILVQKQSRRLSHGLGL